MAHIHGWIARFLRTDPAPGHVRDIGDSGIIQGVAAELLPECFKHRIHECGVEGVGHIEPLRLMPFRLQPFGQRLDRGAGAADNAAVRRIDGGEVQAIGEKNLQILRRHCHGQHRPGRCGLHQTATRGDESQSGIQIHHTGEAGGDIFAQTVADQRRRPDAPMAPECGHRIFDREQGRLRQGGLAQALSGCLFVHLRTGIEQGKKVLADMRLQTGGTIVQRGAEDRFALVKCAGHAGILAALTTAQEDDGRWPFR